jgi:hypothetical protein
MKQQQMTSVLNNPVGCESPTGWDPQSLRKQWNDACLQLGIPALTTATSAKIMAILLHYGNNEAFVLSPHFRADCEYISKRYHIHGSGTPDLEFTEYLKEYNAELEHCEKPPKWAVDLIKGMYNIDIY